MASMLTFVRVICVTCGRVDAGHTLSQKLPHRLCCEVSSGSCNRSPAALYHHGTLPATENSGCHTPVAPYDMREHLPDHPCDLDVDVLFKDTRGDAAIRCSPFSLANRAFVPNDFPTFTACVRDMAAAVDAFLGGAAGAHHAAVHLQGVDVTRSLSLRVVVAGHVDVEVDVFPKRHQTVGGLPGGAVEHHIKSFGGGPRFAGDEVFQYPVAPLNWYDYGDVLVLASSKVLPCLRLCNEQGSSPADSSGSSPSARQAAREDAPSWGEELPPEHPQGLAGWG